MKTKLIILLLVCVLHAQVVTPKDQVVFLNGKISEISHQLQEYQRKYREIEIGSLSYMGSSNSYATLIIVIKWQSK